MRNQPAARAAAPYTQEITPNWAREYMTEDQRFAARRPDVLVYQTEVLDRDVTLAGPLEAKLWVSTTGGDADWIVKLIDAFPARLPPPATHTVQRSAEHPSGLVTGVLPALDAD